MRNVRREIVQAASPDNLFYEVESEVGRMRPEARMRGIATISPTLAGLYSSLSVRLAPGGSCSRLGVFLHMCVGA
jgi:hypothetical protein